MPSRVVRSTEEASTEEVLADIWGENQSLLSIIDGLEYRLQTIANDLSIHFVHKVANETLKALQEWKELRQAKGQVPVMSQKLTRELLFLMIQKVIDERGRQDALKMAGKFQWTCADTVYCPKDWPEHEPPIRITPTTKLAVLAEEFGEVARHVVEGLIDPKRLDKQALQKELIEVATVAIAWCESLEEERNAPFRTEGEPTIHMWNGVAMKEGYCVDLGKLCLACERLGRHLEPIDES